MCQDDTISRHCVFVFKMHLWSLKSRAIYANVVAQPFNRRIVTRHEHSKMRALYER